MSAVPQCELQLGTRTFHCLINVTSFWLAIDNPITKTLPRSFFYLQLSQTTQQCCYAKTSLWDESCLFDTRIYDLKTSINICFMLRYIRVVRLDWTLRRLSSVEIRRLFWFKNFVSYRGNLILDALLNFEPLKRFRNWRYVSEFGSLETAQAEELRTSWRLSWDWGRLRKSELQ